MYPNKQKTLNQFLAYRLRSCSNVKPTLVRRIIFPGFEHTLICGYNNFCTPYEKSWYNEMNRALGHLCG